MWFPGGRQWGGGERLKPSQTEGSVAGETGRGEERGGRKGEAGAGPPVILMLARRVGNAYSRTQETAWERKLVAFGTKLLAL